MMRSIIFFLLVSLSFSGKSQDRVILSDKDTLTVKIVEIFPEKIKYKKLDNLDGPSYVLTKNEISQLILSSGEVIQLEANKKTDQYNSLSKDRKSDNSMSEYYNARRNLIGFNYASLILLNLEFTYERIIDKKGYLGLKIPFLFNMGVDPNYLNKKNIFSTGLHVNVYPFAQRRVAYFTGPVFRYAIMADNDEVTIPPQNSVSIEILPQLSSYFGFYMNNGVLIKASSFLSFGMSLGFGIRRDLSRPKENSTFDMIGEGSVIFRF